jgi:hypothetical protein
METVKFILMSFISLLIIVTNIINICVIRKIKKINKSQRTLIIQLSSVDLTLGLWLALSLALTPMLKIPQLDGSICILMTVIRVALVCLSSVCVFFISLDTYLRYWIVKLIRKNSRNIDKYKKFLFENIPIRFIIALVWILTIITWIIVGLVDRPFYSSDELFCTYNYASDKLAATLLFFIYTLPNVIVISITSYQIYQVAKAKLEFNIHRLNRRRPQIISNEIRILNKTKTLIAVIISTYFITWLPFTLAQFINSITHSFSLSGTTVYFLRIFLYSNSYVNFFVYYSMNHDFSSQTRLLLRLKKTNIIQPSGNFRIQWTREAKYRVSIAEL